MGNWTTVNIVGTCAESEVAELRKALDPGRDYRNFHCLVCGGICGLPNWAGTNINATGNLAERGYNAESVREQLEVLAMVAPSLAVKVHVGGENESSECVATVTLANMVATVGPPEVASITKPSDEQLRAMAFKQLAGF